MIEASIIIVNYNSGQWTRRCIDSLLAHLHSHTFEIIVVDNHSADDSISTLLPLQFNIQLIQQPKNLGFGAACNVGALAAKGDFLLFLNPDTIVQNDVLDYFIPFWNAQQSHLSLACLGAYLIDEKGNEQHSYGVFPTPRLQIQQKIKSLFGKFSKSDGSSLSSQSEAMKSFSKVDYVTGANLFISKERFLNFGGFSSAFFMYFEETDLQQRMFKEGYCAYVIQGPQIMHVKGVTTQGNTTILRVYNFESLFIYIKRHYSKFQFLCFVLIWSFLDIKSLFQFFQIRLFKK